jgi:hypothetical protein
MFEIATETPANRCKLLQQIDLRAFRLQVISITGCDKQRAGIPKYRHGVPALPLVTPCYGRTSQESFEKMAKDFGQWNVTCLIDDGGKGRRRRRATFDQTVIRGSEPHDMIRRGNICSTRRASDSNHNQG